MEGHNASLSANSARCGSWCRCFIRFQDSFDGGLQHIDPQLDEGRTQFLTAPNKSRLPGRATQAGCSQGQRNSKLEQQGAAYGKWGGVS